MPDKMTKGERDTLLSLMKKREGVLKSAAGQRAAEMLAEFERQISSLHAFDKDEIWQEAHDAAKLAVTEAKAKVDARCKELGIPDEFAPTMELHWYPRGYNAINERRAELRRVAKAEIEAVEKRARAEIERISCDAQSEIMAHGLESSASREFFDKLPSVEKLMPMLQVEKIEQATDEAKKARRSHYDLN